MGGATPALLALTAEHSPRRRRGTSCAACPGFTRTVPGSTSTRAQQRPRPGLRLLAAPGHQERR
ncbi:hypothetical protein [Saccharopolyspora hordei]|uniref:Uncharacterized protein n=1 Tax=Saccharopolyspora hordei TaxID=1838 RepID=A0A853ADR2_9PSEU|nr:hypothetical protein [Saccharopolyspora hordei]NYI82632.1 hypothetical protein [Saccharopolyspora hordei]